MERGIATLVHQTQLTTLLSSSNRSDRNPDNAGEVGASTVDVVSSSRMTPRQEEAELDGGFYDHDDDIWYEEQYENEDEVIRQEAEV